MASTPVPDSLRRHVRRHAADYLADPNISSVGIGFKVVGGRRTQTIAVQFSVYAKLDLDRIEDVGSQPIPSSIPLDG